MILCVNLFVRMGELSAERIFDEMDTMVRFFIRSSVSYGPISTKSNGDLNRSPNLNRAKFQVPSCLSFWAMPRTTEGKQQTANSKRTLAFINKIFLFFSWETILLDI